MGSEMCIRDRDVTASSWQPRLAPNGPGPVPWNRSMRLRTCHKRASERREQRSLGSTPGTALPWQPRLAGPSLSRNSLLPAQPYHSDRLQSLKRSARNFNLKQVLALRILRERRYEQQSTYGPTSNLRCENRMEIWSPGSREPGGTLLVAQLVSIDANGPSLAPQTPPRSCRSELPPHRSTLALVRRSRRLQGSYSTRCRPLMLCWARQTQLP